MTSLLVALWLASGAIGVAMFHFDQDRASRAVMWHTRGLWWAGWILTICGPITLLVSAMMTTRPYGLKWTLSERECARAYAAEYPALVTYACMHEFGFSDEVITETLAERATDGV